MIAEVKSFSQGLNVSLEISITGKDLGEKLKKVASLAEVMRMKSQKFASQLYSNNESAINKYVQPKHYWL